MSIPSLSTSVVGSRFISQDDIEAAKARREEEWNAAYARLGREPPQRPVEDSFDGRSLAEKLAANKVAKQEEWEEKTKLANQFRALEEDEIMFLDSLREKQEAEERQRKHQDGEEVKNFRQAVAARTSAANNPPPIPSKPAQSEAPAKSSVPNKRDAKKSLKGVIVKKKTKPIAALHTSSSLTQNPQKPTKDEKQDELPPAKRQKVSEE